MLQLGRTHQGDAGFSGELRVLPEYVYGPGNLVGDTLAGAVTAAEKLKVAEGVVVANAVDVVDGLVGKQFPAEVLFHDVAVLENLAGHQAVITHDVHPHVAVSSLGWLRNYAGSTLAPRSKSMSVFARLAAKKGSLFNIPAWASYVGNFPTTLRAGKFLFSALFCVGLSSNRGAGDRAVERVSTVFHVKGFEVARFHGERAAASLADKINRVFLRSNSAVFRFVGSMARHGAAFSRGISRPDRKAGSAVLAVLLNRHGVVSFQGNATLHRFAV